MLVAEIEHLLGLGDAADAGAREVTARHDHAEGMDRQRLLRYADEAERAVELEEGHVGVEVMLGRDAVQDEVEGATMLGHRGGVGGNDDLMGAEAEAVGDLGRGGGEEHDVRAEGPGELHAHVTEAAEADHADLLARADLPMAERRIGRDARAEQGSRGGEVQALRDAEGEGLVDDDMGGVAAEGVAAEVLVGAVIGEGGSRQTELLQAPLAARAGAAGVDHAARGADVADLDLRDLGADRGDATDDLVARDAGVVRARPFAAGGMDVGVADTAEEDFHGDVGRTGGAPGDLHRGEQGGGGGRTVGLGGGGHGREVFTGRRKPP